MQQNIIAIIQARTGSTRLPKKVLLKIEGKSILTHVIERVKKSKLIDKVIVATTDTNEDLAIVKLCKKLGIDVFQGSVDDVLDRYYQIAKQLNPHHIVRITSDCPLIDPNVIDFTVKTYLKGKFDCVGTNRPFNNITFPDGFDVEIFSFRILNKVWNEAKSKLDREHVTTYIWNHPEKFKYLGIKNKHNLSNFRFVIDEKNDYRLLKLIMNKIKPLTTKNIISFLRSNPKILAINAYLKPNEKYLKAKKNEKN